MSVQIESFASDIGQFTVFSPKNDGAAGTVTVVPGEGHVTSPNGGFGVGGTMVLQNAFTPVTSPSMLVTTKIADNPWLPAAGGGQYMNYAVGILKDGNNMIALEGHFLSDGTTLEFDFLFFFGGAQYNVGGSTFLSPDAIGLGLVGNTVTAWFSIGGVWESAPASTYMITQYDFTAAGALTGWNAWFGCLNDTPLQNPPGYLAFTELRLTQPFHDPTTDSTVPDLTGDTAAAANAALAAANLSTGAVSTIHSATIPAGDVVTQSPLGGAVVNFGSPVDYSLSAGSQITSVYGKFAVAKAFPPTLLIDAKGIEPQIYMIKENVVVQT